MKLFVNYHLWGRIGKYLVFFNKTLPLRFINEKCLYLFHYKINIKKYLLL